VLGDLQVLGASSPRDYPTDAHFIAGRMYLKPDWAVVKRISCCAAKHFEARLKLTKS